MTTDYFVPGGLYRLNEDFYWVGDGIDWDDATDEQLLGKIAKTGDILVFVGFKSCASWNLEFNVLSFVSAEQGGLVHMTLIPDFWERFFKRMLDDDDEQGGTVANSTDEQ
ncbi:MAG: hypothetical protein E6R04_07850 [Spirochaetes bacterium]|nr:MAG: hypothetical protein E6R04_07850 [Spirochaetota bacterium]